MGYAIMHIKDIKSLANDYSLTLEYNRRCRLWAVKDADNPNNTLTYIPPKSLRVYSRETLEQHIFAGAQERKLL